MSTNIPIKEFRFASHSADDQLQFGQSGWADIKDLILNFDENDSGNFLVTLTIPTTWNDSTNNQGANFQVVLRTGPGQEQPLGQGYYSDGNGQQPITFSLVCQAKISPNKGGSAIVAQCQASGGTAYIGRGLSSLSAVGSLAPRKVPYTDLNHFEYPELFSRALLLTNYTETLFITGYSATPALLDLELPGRYALHLTPSAQMQWIVDHLDEFFATIPYADGTGHYSKYDMVYFDLVIDKTVDDKEQTAVLKVLEKWFGPQKSNDPNVPDKLEVKPRPSTGILKKIEALAFPTTQVEIEFILAH